MPEAHAPGLFTRDLYHVLDRPDREAGKLQIPIMEPRWREFFTRRRQRSPEAGEAVTGARMTEPWMCNSARRRRWAARAGARTPNSSLRSAMRPASRVLWAWS